MNETLTELLAQHINEIYPKKVEIGKGICCFCGKRKSGYSAVGNLSNVFTRYQDLTLSGDIICKECFTCLKTQSLRTKDWIATKESLRFLKRTEILPELMKSQSVPWAIYITKTHKKHGWLRGINRINWENNMIFILFEDYIVQTTQEEIKYIDERVGDLLELKIRKSELTSQLWS